MMLLEVLGAFILSIAAVFGLVRVGQNSKQRHKHNTSFYREVDTWKKWNSPGYENFQNR